MCEKILILRKTERDLIKNFYWFPRSVPVILVGFYWNFSDRFSKKLPTPNLIKIRLVRAELFHADRQTNIRTDRYGEANSCFSQLFEHARKSRTSMPSARFDLRDTISRAATDLHLRSPDHRDRPQIIPFHYITINTS